MKKILTIVPGRNKFHKNYELRSMRKEKIMSLYVVESNDSHKSFIIKDLQHLLANANPLRGLYVFRRKKEDGEQGKGVFEKMKEVGKKQETRKRSQFQVSKS